MVRERLSRPLGPKSKEECTDEVIEESTDFRWWHFSDMPGQPDDLSCLSRIRDQCRLLALFGPHRFAECPLRVHQYAP
jgi:hypothetical protein